MEEYDFTTEKEVEDVDDGRDTAYYKDPNGAMTVDDSDGEGEQKDESWINDYRPWREPGFDINKRRTWEIMFTMIPNEPHNGSWAVTEAMLKQQDIELNRYVILSLKTDFL